MKRSRVILLLACAAVLLIAAGAIAIAASGDEEKPKPKTGNLQTISFQQPEQAGPDPFTEPTDVNGPKTVVGKGPYGGTGSDHVCDRDLLIRSLLADPAKLKAWAGVVGIEPTKKAVAKYIAKLHPVTLTRDTRITNHSFVDGEATGFQAILAAGTAVLVDDYGRPVARCRCGNPLSPPEPIKTATCSGCPADYHPPPPCQYGSTAVYRRFYGHDNYTNEDYDTIFIERFPSDFDCYEPYPDPPTVTIIDVYRPPDTTTTTETTPATTAPATTAPSTATPQTTTAQPTTTHESTTPTTTSPPANTNTGPDCPPGFTGFNCQPEHPATETSP